MEFKAFMEESAQRYHVQIVPEIDVLRTPYPLQSVSGAYGSRKNLSPAKGPPTD